MKLIDIDPRRWKRASGSDRPVRGRPAADWRNSMRVGVLSRHIAASTAALTVAALTVAALLSGPALPAQAHASAGSDSVVISGQARFEVLSPTLIRTEYAGD